MKKINLNSSNVETWIIGLKSEKLIYDFLDKVVKEKNNENLSINNQKHS